MPYLALYEHAVEVLNESGSLPNPRDRYRVAGFESGTRHRAEYDTDEADEELFAFILGALRIIDADPNLTDEQRGEIIADLLLLYSYNTAFDEKVIWAAYETYVAARAV